MIIYNVTTIFEDNVHQEYLDFMHKKYMPEILATGYFTDCKLFRLTEPVNEGITYCAQYYAKNQADLDAYQLKHANDFYTAFQNKFVNRHVSFTSILELSDPK